MVLATTPRVFADFQMRYRTCFSRRSDGTKVVGEVQSTMRRTWWKSSFVKSFQILPPSCNS